MSKYRFDFEQDIFECWHIIDDLKQLHSMVCENEDTSKDDIVNVLGGMFTLYDDRFRQLMDSFENLIINGGFAKFGSEHKPVGPLADDPAGTGFKPGQTFNTSI